MFETFEENYDFDGEMQQIVDSFAQKVEDKDNV